MMKKTLIITLILGAVTVGAQAQSYKSAIGLRLGDPTGVTFKTFISKTNALEFLLGTGYWGNNFSTRRLLRVAESHRMDTQP